MIPGYWMHETSGLLRPAVEAYLSGRAMTGDQIAAMRGAYLRQWIFAPGWKGDEVDGLRDRIDSLTSRETITRWLDDAEPLGIDPL